MLDRKIEGRYVQATSDIYIRNKYEVFVPYVTEDAIGIVHEFFRTDPDDGLDIFWVRFDKLLVQIKEEDFIVLDKENPTKQVEFDIDDLTDPLSY
jgi:hypothetical protein